MYEEIEVESWSQVRETYESLPERQFNWIFRGQRDSAWALESTLERALVSRFRIPYHRLPLIEKALVRSFQRGCHIYVDNPPAFDDLLEWWTLMQHYGAPTRLLDWTYSFYVAVYFAIEAAEPGQPCVIWAIDLLKLIDAAKHKLSSEAALALEEDQRVKKPETVRLILDSESLIFPLNPYRLNQRLRIQQSIFLAAANIAKSFASNMSTVLSGARSEEFFKKIIFKFDLLEFKRVLMELRRMNLTAETLFPGIDGFARGLHQKIVMRDVETTIAEIDLPGSNRK